MFIIHISIITEWSCYLLSLHIWAGVIFDLLPLWFWYFRKVSLLFCLLWGWAGRKMKMSSRSRKTRFTTHLPNPVTLVGRLHVHNTKNSISHYYSSKSCVWTNKHGRNQNVFVRFSRFSTVQQNHHSPLPDWQQNLPCVSPKCITYAHNII
jgi:hypothetical protein